MLCQWSVVWCGGPVVTQHAIPGQPLVWWCCAQAACLTFYSDTNITVPSRCVLTSWCPVPSSSVVRAAHSSPQVCSDTLAGSMVQISPSLPMGGEFFPAGCRGWVITSNQWERRRRKGEKEKEIEKSLWRHLIGAPGQVTKSLHLIGQAKPNQLAGRMF